VFSGLYTHTNTHEEVDSTHEVLEVKNQDGEVWLEDLEVVTSLSER
jgi:hypothetical protein